MTMLDASDLRGGRSAAPPTGIPRLLAAGDASLAAHLARFGGLPAGRDADSVITELERAGLEGRGGAAFPTWRKLASAAGSGRAGVVIANGSEGEPLSAKDATLLHHAPHLVLDGLLLVAASLGASESHLVTTAAQLAPVQRAIAERGDAGRIRLRETEDRFISGEASAVVNAIERARAIPRDHVVRLSISGLGGRPTLVLNVETLAHIALVLRFGADWFRSLGTSDDPGTRLLTVVGPEGSVVVEAAGGTPLRTALRAGGVDPASVRALLVGGYHGAWVAGDALDTPLSATGLAPFGAAPGAGILMVLRRGQCGLDRTAEITRYLASQSAGQCGPCANGLPELAELMGRIAHRDRDASLPRQVKQVSGLVTGRGACHHPDGTARMVLSALGAFDRDVHAHALGLCQELVS
ncbi:MAG: NADH-quinone oxidoreductase subunit F [Actinomycetota bacterium]|nr:NADH-quinone oxidoreductase subunit F [Actinomycetota bacterium]